MINLTIFCFFSETTGWVLRLVNSDLLLLALIPPLFRFSSFIIHLRQHGHCSCFPRYTPSRASRLYGRQPIFQTPKSQGKSIGCNDAGHAQWPRRLHCLCLSHSKFTTFFLKVNAPLALLVNQDSTPANEPHTRGNGPQFPIRTRDPAESHD